MNTQHIVALVGIAITIGLYFFSPFFRARKVALIIFAFAWLVFIAGFFGGALTYDYPLWSYPLAIGMLCAMAYAIYDEYKHFRGK